MACEDRACCSKKTAEAFTIPGASWLPAAVATIDGLILLARTGKSLTEAIKDAKLQELADSIRQLVAENQWLKKIARPDPVTPTVSPIRLTFSFGPAGNYSLIIPAADQTARHQLADQLLVAAQELQDPGAKKVTAQRLLPLFDEPC